MHLFLRSIEGSNRFGYRTIAGFKPDEYELFLEAQSCGYVLEKEGKCMLSDSGYKKLIELNCL